MHFLNYTHPFLPLTYLPTYLFISAKKNTYKQNGTIINRLSKVQEISLVLLPNVIACSLYLKCLPQIIATHVEQVPDQFSLCTGALSLELGFLIFFSVLFTCVILS